MPLIGTVEPPGDKSISHRAVLFSLLARGRCRIENLSPGGDVRTSLGIVKTLGGQVDQEEGAILIQGPGQGGPDLATLDCGNSGTTIRLLMGLLAGRPGEYLLDGDKSLRRRPMERIAEPLRRMGALIDCRAGCCPVRIRGAELSGITYTLPVPSAQLKSAVLLAGLRAQGATEVVEPIPSRDHTERMIASMGGSIETAPGAVRVRGSELTLPKRFRVPGDPSSAAFFLCAAAVLPGSRVEAQGVLLNPTRTGFVEVLQRMGAGLEIEPRGSDPEPWGDLTVVHGESLKGCRISAREMPALIDEVPILALTATQAQGRTVFEDIRELRHKESDRVAALVEELGAMGADLEVSGHSLVITGPTRPAPTRRPDSRADHRMAMTLALALVLAGEKPEVAGAESAAISYPGFWDDLGRIRQ